MGKSRNEKNKGWSKEEKYEIAQLVLKGGKILIKLKESKM